MAQLWGGRFTKETDKLVYNFNASISFDQKFYKQDIRGSIAHVTMLAEQGILTEEEKELFNIACGDYQFPLGTPVTVGSRPIENATEYKYTVDSNGATSTIYVILGNEEGAKPEFTQVVR